MNIIRTPIPPLLFSPISLSCYFVFSPTTNTPFFSFLLSHTPPLHPKLKTSKISENQITAKLCLERIHSSEVDRTRISQSALNNLTEGDFVFMVVDMMKNSGWYGQADRILELVGVSVGLQNEDDDYSSGNSTTSTKRKREE